jgi:formylglycine-generating enzyme required for sulfatase activity
MNRPAKVGSYPGNALGIHDMHGNVWEWCQDLHEDGRRMDRGGSYGISAASCRASYRDRSDPASSTDHLGLRLARVPVR